MANKKAWEEVWCGLSWLCVSVRKATNEETAKRVCDDIYDIIHNAVAEVIGQPNDKEE